LGSEFPNAKEILDSEEDEQEGGDNSKLTPLPKISNRRTLFVN
jgi:hypothetical protein